jgi:Uncharacterised nucleotidyltransferase
MPQACASTLFGELIARALAGAWRSSPPPLDISTEELEKIASLLLGSGAAALIWAKLRLSDAKGTPAALEFQQAYLLHSLQAAIHNSDVQEVIKLLDSAGVEPLLVKGWAVARLYPEMGLRPYGDIDLCLKPEQYEAATAVMSTPEGEKYNVDMHKGLEKLDDQSLDKLFARSQTIRLGEVYVRMPRLEDQLRILCTHLLRHGAWRPLWLCDIAAIVESLPADFDWGLCLGADRRQADWIACSIGLAHQLLGARVDDTPVSGRARSLPSWLKTAVLKQWKQSRAIDHTPPELMAVSLRHLARLPKALHERWPNPVQATFNLKAPFNDLPRLPFQVGEYASQVFSFLSRLPKLLGEQ